MTASEQIAKLIAAAGSQLVSVTFIKKDGSHRQLTFNPTDRTGIKGTGTRCQNPNIFRVRDLDLGQWRSFDASRCLTLAFNGVEYQIA